MSMHPLPSLVPPLPSLPQLAPDSGLWRALREALADRRSGEIVLRCGDHTGRIHVVGGEIAWAQHSSQRLPLGAILKLGGVQIDPDTVQEVLEECKRERLHFIEVLEAWGLATREQSREGVRWFLVEQLRQMLAVQGATVLFLPSLLRVTPALTFALEELVELPRPSSGVYAAPPTLQESPELRKKLDEVKQHPGVLGLALWPRGGAREHLTMGEAPDQEQTQALLGALRLLGEQEGHVLVGSERQGLAAQALGPWAVVLGFDPGQITQGLVLKLLRSLR